MTDVAALASSPGAFYFAVGLISGLCVPFQDGMRSLRGFGRWAFDKLPQKEREGAQ